MKKLTDIFKNPATGVATIGLVYLTFGLAWITFSDALVQSFFMDSDIEVINAVQTFKGYGYIFVTTVLLMLLINTFAHKLKKATQQQQEAGNTLKKLVEEVGVGIARLDLKGNFLYANPDCCEFFGYTEEELSRKNIFEFTHPEDHENDQKCWNRLLARETNDIQKEKRFFNKYNQINWAQEKVTLIDDSNRDPRYVVLVIQDINNLKKAEIQLERNIRYYQTVLENSFDGVSILDKTGLIKYQTPSVERIIGYPTRTRVGNSAFSFIISEDLPKVQTILHQLVQGEIPEARTVIRYLRGDKELRYLDIYVKNMLADELIQGLVVNFRDITDQYLMEHKLIESEEQYKLLFLHNPIPVFIYDPKTLNYLQVNDAAVKNYGYTRNEFLGMNLRDIRPKEDIAQVLEDIAKLEAGAQESTKIWRHLTKSGELKYVEISAINIQYNGQKARMSIANDVTHIINNQESMRQSEERYRHLVENLPAGAVLVREDELYFNKAVSDITGYSLEEITSLDSWFTILYGEDAELIKKYYTEDRKSKFDAPRTVSIFTKDGKKKWVTFYAYKFDTGEVWLLQDVTERKRMDELIINSMLEAEDRERKRLAEELHDGLGNLLVSANYKLENIKEQMAGWPAEQRELLTDCHAMIQKAIAGTRSIATNLIPLHMVDEDIIEVLRDLFAQAQTSTGLNIDFHSALEDRIINPHLANNLYRIGQEAVNHVLKNAQATQITVTIGKDALGLLFTIKDNGKGFETEEVGHMGTGLTNINNRVQALGGTLDIQIIPGEGTSLNMAIPHTF